MKLSSKHGINSVIKLFQGSKILFTIKKDKKCKVFGFWAKIVKVAKSLGFNRKTLSRRAETAKE